jgi:hypothetical protein
MEAAQTKIDYVTEVTVVSGNLGEKGSVGLRIIF